jgi:hypothetical protein
MTRLFSVMLLATGAILAARTPAQAASPTLVLSCGAPINAMVTCNLAGHRFHARERVTISYRVAVHPGKTKVYRRHAQTDAHGSFSRPPISFSGGNNGLFNYRIKATVNGNKGDRATATAQGQS